MAHFIRLNGISLRDCLIAAGYVAIYRGKGSGAPPTKVALKKRGCPDIRFTLVGTIPAKHVESVCKQAGITAEKLAELLVGRPSK